MLRQRHKATLAAPITEVFSALIQMRQEAAGLPTGGWPGRLAYPRWGTPMFNVTVRLLDAVALSSVFGP